MRASSAQICSTVSASPAATMPPSRNASCPSGAPAIRRWPDASRLLAVKNLPSFVMRPEHGGPFDAQPEIEQHPGDIASLVGARLRAAGHPIVEQPVL